MKKVKNKNKKKFPIFGWISVWPTLKIVRVKVEPSPEYSIFPLMVSSLQGEKINEISNHESFQIQSLDVIKLYSSRKKAEKETLNQLHSDYSKQRRELRQAQKKYKWCMERVAEFKHMKMIQNNIFFKNS